MDDRPSGRVTFLFTDLEGSTRYWERAPREMPAIYTRHDHILRAAVNQEHGVVYKVIGDAFQIAFPGAARALRAAIAAQRQLVAEPWPLTPAPRVRMALHVIDVAPDADGDYRTAGLNRLGRLLVAADGGQVLLSEQLARELADIPADVEIVDLGEHQFRDLTPQHVFQVLAAGLPPDRAALRALKPHRHNLPSPATTFIGRDRELQLCEDALCTSPSRILTLIGPGGIGKTRLAVEIALRVVDRFADGVWFVALASVASAELVLPEIAGVLGVRESIDQTTIDAIVAHLADRHTLLVLDNVDHVVGVAGQLATFISRCPNVRILTTSRIPLGIAAEQEFPVPPLAVGPADRHLTPDTHPSPAIQLFVERTRSVVPDFRLTPETIDDVTAICQRLDGLPLAIELAAARGRLLPPAKLLSRLQSRLPLLTGGPRDAPLRQQTLRNAIAWSYDLLEPDERALFARLSVFAGGGTLEAIEGICGGDDLDDVPIDRVLDLVESLVRQSLLNQDPDAGDARVAMLETIREFARERLDAAQELEGIARRHAAFFLAYAEEAAPHFSGPDQADWLDAAAREHDNLRAALSFLAESGLAGELARLCGALWRFWWIRGFLREGRGWMTRALALANDGAVADADLARLLDGAGALAEAQGDIDLATGLHERSLSLWQRAGDRLGQARALQNLGIIALHDRGDAARARELHTAALALFQGSSDRQGVASSLKNLGDTALAEEALAEASSFYTQALVIARELRDTLGIAAALTSLGALAFFDVNAERAVALYEESLSLWRALGDVPAVALVLGNLGEALDHLGDVDGANALYEECLRLSRELGDQQGIAFAQSHLGRIARRKADLALAARHYADSAELSRDIGDSARLAESVEGLAGTLLDSGEAAAAARLLGMAMAIRESASCPLHSVHAAAHERDLTAVRGLLGPDAFAALLNEGAAVSPSDLALGVGAPVPASPVGRSPAANAT